MNPFSLILASLAATTAVLPLAFAQEQEVFSVLDKDDIIMHAYTDRNQRVTFSGRFNGDGEMTQSLPFASNIRSIQVVYGQESASCRFRYGTEFRASALFGPSSIRSPLLVPQAHMLECAITRYHRDVSREGSQGVPMIRGGNTELRGGDGRILTDDFPESDQKTTFFKE